MVAPDSYRPWRQRTLSSLTSDGWRAAHGSAPSLHKHGSSMAANSSGSSDREKIAQQRLKIIAGHLQKSESAVSAAECKAPRSNTDVSGEGKTVPRRRYEALNTDGLKESNVFGFCYLSSPTLGDRCIRKRHKSMHCHAEPRWWVGSSNRGRGYWAR